MTECCFFKATPAKQHRTTVLHNHWFLVEEGGGIGWHCFLNGSECCSIVNNKSHMTARIKSGKVFLLSWKSEIDNHVC